MKTAAKCPRPTRFAILVPAMLALTALAGPSAAAAEGIFADDFKSYVDFDPAVKNWSFYGVGGEVIDGKYLFRGVASSSLEYGDIRPDYTLAQVRNFAAGPALKINAKLRVCPHKYAIFAPGKGEERRFGLVVLDRSFVRRQVYDMGAPRLELMLNLDAQDRKSLTFAYAGQRPLKVSTQTQVEGTEWQNETWYDLELRLEAGKAVATVQAEGKVVYQAELTCPEFAEVFAQARPGFGNRRLTGELADFKADNLKSGQTKTDNFAFRELPLPKTWQASRENAQIDFELGQTVDFGARFGGFGLGKEVVLTSEVEVPETCYYTIYCQADWFWKLRANGGAEIVNYMKHGSGAGPVLVLLPLQAGRNRLELTLGSGSGGWKFCFSSAKADPDKVRTELSRLNVFGSDTLFWNLDRILDDLRNLRRYGLELADLEQELVGLRKTLSISLDSQEIAQYDPVLDRAYGRVYDAYRYVELQADLAEFKALDVAAPRTAELEKLAEELKRQIIAGAAIEPLAQAAQKIVDACRQDLHGLAEGVTRGGSFGRFGWITSDRLGAYSSGDGLLANQVLSSGAIARQYVTAAGKAGENYQVKFAFAGEKDPEAEAALSALPTIGANVEVQFGYDPSQFYSGGTPETVKVKEINWIHKRFVYDQRLAIDACLAAPALLVEGTQREFVLTDSPSGPFTHIGLLDAEGKASSFAISQPGVIYDLEAQGRLHSNWVVLWNGGDTETDLTGHVGNIPLQVIFQRQPRKIERDGATLRFTFARAGAVWLNTLYGARLQPTGNWRGQLPPKAVAKAEFFGQSALAYPSACREFYRYDAAAGRVEIRNQYTFRRFDDNDWNLKPREVCVLPPVLALMLDQGFDAQMPGELRDLDYPTIYGPLYGVEANELVYSLPVPAVPEIALPANTEADLRRVADLCRHTLEDTEGGRFRMYDETKDRDWCSLNFNGNGLAKQWQYLDPTFQAYVKGLCSYDMPASANYRETRVWRSLIESYSGRKYYYSFSISSGRPGNLGVFGDRGYGVGLHLVQLDAAASLNADYAQLRRVWRDERPLASPEAIRDGRLVTVDKMLGYIKNVHDWAWMEDGSNDCGDNGPVVDCSQAPFAGHAARLRMARKIGSAAEIANSAYHLAKGQLSLIARLPFTTYGQANGLMGLESVNTGFRECITPQCFANSPLHGKTKRNEYDGSYVATLCYATKDDGFDVYFPYAKYIWNDLRHYEDVYQQYYPNSDTERDAHAHLFARLMFLTLNGKPLAELWPIYDNMVANVFFYQRNLAERANVPLLLAGGAPLILTEWYPLPTPEFKFTPSTKQAAIRLASVPADYRLRGLSSLRPASVTAGGAALEWSHDPDTYALEIKVPAGRDVAITIQYDQIDPTRFMPLPIPPAPRAFPQIQGQTPCADFARSWGKILWTCDFTGEPGADPRPAGGFNFSDWGKSQAPASGGLTGSHPATGTPAQALAVKATTDNFTGRAGPMLKLPKNLTSLTIAGKVLRSADYRGNRPMVFAWIVGEDQKGTPQFYDLPPAENGQWQEFEFRLPASKLPADYRQLQINLTNRRIPGAAEVGGEVYYQNVRLYAE